MSSQDQPMRVSEWAKGAPAAQPPRPVAPPVRRDGLTPASPAVAAEKNETASSSLPVDPWRLAAGLWKRRFWLALALLVGLAAGASLGLLKAKTRYLATVQLIKRETPSSFRVSDVGESFRPHELTAGTLVGTAMAPAVIERVAAKSSPKVEPDLLENNMEVKDLRNTEFVFLTLSGFRSPQATVELANIWGNEVVQFTRELQAQESHEMRQFLQHQVDETDADLKKVNDQILDFSRMENLVDADKQIDAYLRSLGDLDLKYEAARIDLESMDFKISDVESELRRQSPLADKLKTAQSELDALRASYTDQNPLVVEKLDAVHGLESQLQAEANHPTADVSNFAGTTLGNTLYLDYVQYQSEKKGLLRQKEELEKLRDQEKEKLNSIPQKAAAFAELSMRRQSLQTARNLLYSRLREATLFDENAPGYYLIFAPASVDRVIKHGCLTKMAVFTAAGGLFFTFSALLLALTLELTDSTLRTPGEAARAFEAPLLASLEKNEPDADCGAAIWARWIGSETNTGVPRVLWSPSPGPEEDVFWTLLFERAERLLPGLRVIDCGKQPLAVPHGAGLKIERIDPEAFSLAETRQFAARLREEARRGEEIWIRVAGELHEPFTTLVACGREPLILARLHAEKDRFWKTQGELLKNGVGRAAGVIAVGEIPWHRW